MAPIACGRGVQSSAAARDGADREAGPTVASVQARARARARARLTLVVPQSRCPAIASVRPRSSTEPPLRRLGCHRPRAAVSKMVDLQARWASDPWEALATACAHSGVGAGAGAAGKGNLGARAGEGRVRSGEPTAVVRERIGESGGARRVPSERGPKVNAVEKLQTAARR